MARPRRLFLANKVAAARRAHAGGVHGRGWNVATFPDAVRRASAFHRKCHFPFEDYVRSLNRVRVASITAVRPVFPYVCVTKALAMQLLFKLDRSIEGSLRVIAEA